MNKRLFPAGAVAILALFAALAQFITLAHAQISPNDTARYLAGLKPAPGSPLAALTAEPAWQRHAAVLNKAWARLEKNQLAPIRTWSRAHLTAPKELMLYMFSGPDFLYANAFYPHAKVYVLSALEAVGRYPDMTSLSRNARALALQELRGSMQTVLSYSFFITKQMKTELHSGTMRGALPLLFVFLARSGNSIDRLDFVDLNDDGTVTARQGGRTARGSAPGVKIVFTGKGGEQRRLYYFRTDLSNGGLKRSGFEKFVRSFGPADSLIKSASYLLHSGNFSTARKLLLENSATIVQDPSGIPLRYFDRTKWELHPFGKYAGPIPLFKQHYQRDLRRLFTSGAARPIKFGIGYRWRTHETSVLLAIRKP